MIAEIMSKIANGMKTKKIDDRLAKLTKILNKTEKATSLSNNMAFIDQHN